MRVTEIPRSEWRNFLEGFASRHQGWLADLERRQHGNGSIPLVLERPLHKINVDPKAGGRIVLVFGRPDGAQTSQTVDAPIRIKFLEAEPGADAGLEIESADGTSLVMRFRSAMPPEMVDGIAA
jgi:hypothetical protein